MNKLAAALIAVTLLITGCNAGPPAPSALDADLDAVAAQSEIAPVDDPYEQHAEKREALLARQSREFDEMDREFDKVFNDQEMFCHGADHSGFEVVSDDSLRDEAKCADAEAAFADWERRSDELTERHDEELDALDRELTAP